MGKKFIEDPPAGAPEWIVTFSDMVSLLVTFFVMLMSFSSMDDNDSMVIRQAFANSPGGVLLNLKGPSAVDSPPVDHMTAVHPVRGSSTPHMRDAEQLLDNLLEMGQRKEDEQVELDLNAMPDGLVVVFHERSNFGPGEDALPAALEKDLRELARVLKHYPFWVVVEGYTDSAFQASTRHATPTELSLARAALAADVLADEAPILRAFMQISGQGERSPRGSNDTADGRRKNRRVEVRLLSMSESRAARFKRAREAETEQR